MASGAGARRRRGSWALASSCSAIVSRHHPPNSLSRLSHLENGASILTGCKLPGTRLLLQALCPLSSRGTQPSGVSGVSGPPSSLYPAFRFPFSGLGPRGRCKPEGGERCRTSVSPVPPAGGRSGEPWTARHAAQRGLGGAGAPGAASGCGGHLGARPALRGRPRRGLARGCPAGPASAPAAHERQRAQRGPGR